VADVRIQSSNAFDHTPQGREYWEEATAVEAWIEDGAPSPLAMWLELQGRPPSEDDALTVAQAAKRENCSTKTIYRRLPDLLAMDPPGAHKTGRTWRIVPAGLDALREHPRQSSSAPPRKRGRRAARQDDGTLWRV